MIQTPSVTTNQPSYAPTSTPTEVPTTVPTNSLTPVPTASPTPFPSHMPTDLRTLGPTEEPTVKQTEMPTDPHTAAPTKPFNGCSTELCSGHGQCEQGVTGLGYCVCDRGWSGHYCSAVPLQLTLFNVTECGGPPLLSSHPFAQSLSCTDRRLQELGSARCVLTVLESPSAGVNCAIVSDIPTEAGVEQAEVTFNEGSEQETGAFFTVFGRKDLKQEAKTEFLIQATCSSTDRRFDTATVTASAFITDWHFPQVSQIMPVTVSEHQMMTVESQDFAAPANFDITIGGVLVSGPPVMRTVLLDYNGTYQLWEVDIDDDGTVRIYAANAEAKNAAVALVQEIVAEAEVGRIYHGKVERIVDFGAFVNILPGKDGLLHISQIAEERVENVTDYLKEGEEIDVVVLDVDQRGRIKLSVKELPKYQNDDAESDEASEASLRSGSVKST